MVIAGDVFAVPAPGVNWFNRWDADKDGKLSRDEFIALRLDAAEKYSKGKLGQTEEQWQKRKPLVEVEKKAEFLQNDSNKDGYLTYEEFVKVYAD